jgi:hypothetical protein
MSKRTAFVNGMYKFAMENKAFFLNFIKHNGNQEKYEETGKNLLILSFFVSSERKKKEEKKRLIATFERFGRPKLNTVRHS